MSCMKSVVASWPSYLCDQAAPLPGPEAGLGHHLAVEPVQVDQQRALGVPGQPVNHHHAAPQPDTQWRIK